MTWKLLNKCGFIFISLYKKFKSNTDGQVRPPNSVAMCWSLLYGCPPVLLPPLVGRVSLVTTNYCKFFDWTRTRVLPEPSPPPHTDYSSTTDYDGNHITKVITDTVSQTLSQILYLKHCITGTVSQTPYHPHKRNNMLQVCIWIGYTDMQVLSLLCTNGIFCFP